MYMTVDNCYVNVKLWIFVIALLFNKKFRNEYATRGDIFAQVTYCLHEYRSGCAVVKFSLEWKRSFLLDTFQLPSWIKCYTTKTMVTQVFDQVSERSERGMIVWLCKHSILLPFLVSFCPYKINYISGMSRVIFMT